jgi:hypothetical protein
MSIFCPEEENATTSIVLSLAEMERRRNPVYRAVLVSGHIMRIAVFIAAGLEILLWLFRLPGAFAGDLSGPFTASYVTHLVNTLIVFPALAVTALWLAYRVRWLRLAAALAAIEPALFFLNLIAEFIRSGRFGF